MAVNQKTYGGAATPGWLCDGTEYTIADYQTIFHAIDMHPTQV